MKSKLLAGLILAGGSLFAGPRISVGFGFSAPAPVTAYVGPGYAERAYTPPCPGPDYVFVNGYWQHRPLVIHRDRDFDRHHFDRRESFRHDFYRR